MADILRGSIHWADLDPTVGREQSGRRPVLILSENIFNRHSGTVIAVAITSQEPKANYPLTSEIVGTGLPKQSWAKMSQVRTLSVTRIGDKIASATTNEMEIVLAGLNEILGG